MEFESIFLYFFYTIQIPICYVGCLMITNTWTYISPYTSGILLSSPSNLVNWAKCSYHPSKYAADWSVVIDYKSLLNFKVIFFLNLVQSNWYVRGYVDMRIGDIRCLIEGAGRWKATSRIIRNHPCDVRELKNSNQQAICSDVSIQPLYAGRPE